MAHRPYCSLYRDCAVRGGPGYRGRRKAPEPEHPPGGCCRRWGGPPNRDPGNRAALRAGDGPENTP